MDTRVSAQQLRTFMERAYEKEGFKKEDEAQADRLKNGVPVEEKTLAELREIAAGLGIEGV